MTPLMEQITALSLAEKELLCSELERQIQQTKRFGNCNLGELTKQVCEIVGISRINHKSRKRRYIVAKVILANALLETGLPMTRVGSLMNKSHTTIQHYKGVLDNWKSIPGAYRMEVDMWNKLNDRI